MSEFSVMMNLKEIHFLEGFLTTCGAEFVLEWGSGGSTIIFPPLCTNLKRWVAIEHDFEWSEKVRLGNENEKVELFYVPPDSSWQPQDESLDSLSHFWNYVLSPKLLDLQFDLIFIDGRARTSCLIEGEKVLTKNGFVVLHDVVPEHTWYAPGLKLYRQVCKWDTLLVLERR